MTPIASDLSYLVLKARQERGDFDLQGGDTAHRLYGIPSHVAAREEFFAERKAMSDTSRALPRAIWLDESGNRQR